MSRLETIDVGVTDAYALDLGTSSCGACRRWSAELEAHLGDASRWPEVRFGKILLDTPGLAGFKRDNPWVADLSVLPSTQIYVRGERVKGFAGGGVPRLQSRLRRIAATGQAGALGDQKPERSRKPGDALSSVDEACPPS